MSDWHPEVVRLGKIEPLPDSDFLEITTVMGVYPCILKKGKYKEGDLVSYLPNDSVVPDQDIWHFLAPRELKDEQGNILRECPPVGSVPEKYRTIKSKSIRGTYSEGLVMDAPEGFAEGDSIVEHFELVKRVYPEEVDKTGARECESDPEGLKLFKYDLEGMAKYGKYFDIDEQVIAHEKLDGENCAIVYFNDRLYVRSRNLFKKEIEGSYWWKAAYDLQLQDKLKAYPGLVLWGELIGGIKGFKYNCLTIKNVIQRKFILFDIWDNTNQKFLEWSDVLTIAKQLDIETVPVLYEGPWKGQELFYLAEGKSTIGDCVREGFVMRSVPECYHRKLGRKIIKLKGQEYKLKKG